VALLYLSLDRAPDAVTHFTRAAELAPNDAAAHFNLATALSVAGQLDNAVRAYREALRLRPGYAAASNNLGSVLAAQGDVRAALVEFRAAVAADPGNVQAHRNLAWHLAHSPDITQNEKREAVRAGERAAALTHRADANVLDALAAAYAAAGQDAAAAETRAIARRLRNGG
jgi:tetratricopeptide (TPR) repeat protein